MPKLRTISEQEAPAQATYAGPTQVSGVEWSKRLSPDDYPLWLCVSQLAAGARMTWAAGHGEEAVYVLDGTLEVEGRSARQGSALILESGVPVSCTASEPARIAHFGSWDRAVPGGGPYGPPAAERHCVHVVGPNGWFESGARESVRARWFADSTCATCRLTLLLVERGPAELRPGPQHTHSQDEIIYLLRGSVLLGRREYGPGSVLCIPADMRYALTHGRNGYGFLNFRRDVSEQTYFDKDGPPRIELEGGLARGGFAVLDLANIPISA